jgi:hypothetical protein
MTSLILVLIISAQRPGACFLLIPPSAKATGMAYAWTAIADDASANYYNAAGLAFLNRSSVTMSYFKYLPGLKEGMQYIYLGAVYPISRQHLGFDLNYFSVGKEEVIDQNGQYIGEHIIYRTAVKSNYASSFTKDLSYAIALKFIYQCQKIDYWNDIYMSELGLDGGTGFAWTADVNLLYKIVSFMSVGLVLHNLGPKIKFHEYSSSDPLPLLSRLGLACKPLELDNISITLSVEMTKVLVGMFANTNNSFGENLKYEFKEAWKAMGLEVKYFKMLSLRTGYFYDYEGMRSGWTFGGGIKVLNLEIDVGIDEDVFDFETQNRKLSLTYTF